MRNAFEDFVEEFDENYCYHCSNYKVFGDWDEGGSEIAGGMPPRRIIVHECLFNARDPRNNVCQIRKYAKTVSTM